MTPYLEVQASKSGTMKETLSQTGSNTRTAQTESGLGLLSNFIPRMKLCIALIKVAVSREQQSNW